MMQNYNVVITFYAKPCFANKNKKYCYSILNANRPVYNARTGLIPRKYVTQKEETMAYLIFMWRDYYCLSCEDIPKICWRRNIYVYHLKKKYSAEPLSVVMTCIMQLGLKRGGIANYKWKCIAK